MRDFPNTALARWIELLVIILMLPLIAWLVTEQIDLRERITAHAGLTFELIDAQQA